MLPTADTTETGKYVVMVPRGKANIDRLRDWYNDEIRTYFEEDGMQKEGWPPTSTFQAGFQSSSKDSSMHAMCQDLHQKVAQATAKQRAQDRTPLLTSPIGQGTMGFNNMGGRGGMRGRTTGGRGRGGGLAAWTSGASVLVRGPLSPIVEDLEVEHTVTKECRLVAPSASQVAIAPTDLSEKTVDFLMEKVAERLGIHGIQQTVQELVHKNRELEDQNQQLEAKVIELQQQTEELKEAVSGVERALEGLDQIRAEAKTNKQELEQMQNKNTDTILQTMMTLLGGASGKPVTPMMQKESNGTIDMILDSGSPVKRGTEEDITPLVNKKLKSRLDSAQTINPAGQPRQDDSEAETRGPAK